MSNVTTQPAESFQVTLGRNNTGESWGFRLQGGADFSIPLSIQSCTPNGIGERYGLQAGDAIIAINGYNTDGLSHEDCKQQIVRAGTDLEFYIQRGAVNIWKPQVTAMKDLRPNELNKITSATGDNVALNQRTSLKKSAVDVPCTIGVSHNRTAQGFDANKTATANVVHAQFNTPIGMYSPDNIAHAYSSQTAGIEQEMAGVDVKYQQVGDRMSGTYQPLGGQQGEAQPAAAAGPPGFKSISAPVYKPPTDKPAQPSMRCGGCDMLVTGVFVKAGGQPYHANCFKCTTCSVGLKQLGYFVVDGKLYCENHAKRHTKPPGDNMVASAVYR